MTITRNNGKRVKSAFIWILLFFLLLSTYTQSTGTDSKTNFILEVYETLNDFDDSVEGLGYSSTGKYFGITTFDNSYYFYDVEKGYMKEKWEDKVLISNNSGLIAFSNIDNIAVLGRYEIDNFSWFGYIDWQDKSYKIYNFLDRRDTKNLNFRDYLIEEISFSPNAGLFTAAIRNNAFSKKPENKLYFWRKTDSGEDSAYTYEFNYSIKIDTGEDDNMDSFNFEFNHNKKRTILALNCNGNEIKVFSLINQHPCERQTLCHPINRDKGNSVKDISFSYHEDNALLAVAYEDGSISIWQQNDTFWNHYTLIESCRDHTISDIVFSPSNNYFAVVTADNGIITFWRLTEDGFEIIPNAFLPSFQNGKYIAFSPDSNYFASSYNDENDSKVIIWKINDETLPPPAPTPVPESDNRAKLKVSSRLCCRVLKPNERITLYVTIKNLGDCDAKDVQLKLHLPEKYIQINPSIPQKIEKIQNLKHKTFTFEIECTQDIEEGKMISILPEVSGRNIELALPTEEPKYFYILKQ